MECLQENNGLKSSLAAALVLMVKNTYFKEHFTNTETSSGKPYQYVFEAEGKPQIIMMYKEARSTMGAMIDKYNKLK
ncbi:hypothetical protein H6F38_14020 [Paenibacillus sp. EKM208P]|nr:hypothetical protein H6F38_14020 [Paenibacillus sp. EKM208P]